MKQILSKIISNLFLNNQFHKTGRVQTNSTYKAKAENKKNRISKKGQNQNIHSNMQDFILEIHTEVANYGLAKTK